VCPWSRVPFIVKALPWHVDVMTSCSCFTTAATAVTAAAAVDVGAEGQVFPSPACLALYTDDTHTHTHTHKRDTHTVHTHTHCTHTHKRDTHTVHTHTVRTHKRDTHTVHTHTVHTHTHKHRPLHSATQMYRMPAATYVVFVPEQRRDLAIGALQLVLECLSLHSEEQQWHRPGSTHGLSICHLLCLENTSKLRTLAHNISLTAWYRQRVAAWCVDSCTVLDRQCKCLKAGQGMYRHALSSRNPRYQLWDPSEAISPDAAAVLWQPKL
jgi:hypothetical protein